MTFADTVKPMGLFYTPQAINSCHSNGKYKERSGRFSYEAFPRTTFLDMLASHIGRHRVTVSCYGLSHWNFTLRDYRNGNYCNFKIKPDPELITHLDNSLKGSNRYVQVRFTRHSRTGVPVMDLIPKITSNFLESARRASSKYPDQRSFKELVGERGS